MIEPSNRTALAPNWRHRHSSEGGGKAAQRGMQVAMPGQLLGEERLQATSLADCLAGPGQKHRDVRPDVEPVDESAQQRPCSERRELAGELSGGWAHGPKKRCDLRLEEVRSTVGHRGGQKPRYFDVPRMRVAPWQLDRIECDPLLAGHRHKLE